MDQRLQRHSLTPLVVLVVLTVAVVLALLYLNLAAFVFRLLGLSTAGALLLVVGSLLGGMINIPLTRRKIVLADPALEQLPPLLRWLLPILHYYPPAVVEQVVAVNVGGALVPLVFSAYLLTLPYTPVVAAVAATVVVALVTKLIARPVPGMGVTLPTFIPPLVTAVAARTIVLLLGAPVAGAAPVAYIAGTLGTLIGADLLNLPRILRGSLVKENAEREVKTEGGWFPVSPDKVPVLRRRYIASIGGSGVFDGIFLTGILAPILAMLGSS